MSFFVDHLVFCDLNIFFDMLIMRNNRVAHFIFKGSTPVRAAHKHVNLQHCSFRSP